MSGTVTSRRAFLRRAAAAAAVAAPAIWIPRRAVAQLNSPGFVAGLARAAVGGGGACTVWSSQTTDNNYWNPTGGGTCAQRVQNAEAREVCKVLLKTYHSFGTSMDLRCAIASDSTGSSIIGTWSNTATLATSTPTWLEFSWASNPTTPSGDFFLVFDQITTDVGWRIRVNSGGSHTYSFYQDGVQKPISDACYEIHTVQ